MKKLKAILSAGIALCIGVSSLTTAFAAEEATFTYEKIGDFNLNKVVDVSDVTTLQMQLAGYDAVAENAMHMTDFNGDEIFDVNDITEIQKMLTGLYYTCYSELDSSYLDMKIWHSGMLPQVFENQIEFEHIFSSDELLPVVNKQDFLINSKEQFAHLFGATSPDFDNSFFEEYSLFIWYTNCDDPIYIRKITEMGIEGNQLVMNKYTYYPRYPGYEPKDWTLFFKIKKSDISNVESVYIHDLVMAPG